jgi:hypothetical protein
MAKVRRLSKMTLAKRRAGMAVNYKYIALSPDWASIPRLNARPFQRKKKLHVLVGAPNGRKFYGIRNIAKRTPLQSQQVNMHNRYQTIHGMRARVSGDWNVKLNYIP